MRAPIAWHIDPQSEIARARPQFSYKVRRKGGLIRILLIQDTMTQMQKESGQSADRLSALTRINLDRAAKQRQANADFQDAAARKRKAPPVTQYERDRLKRIATNEDRLKAMGIF